MDDGGRAGDIIGLSDGKKLDFPRLGDGVGGIWERVSMARSDREGLGLRRGTDFDITPSSTLSSFEESLSVASIRFRSVSRDMVAWFDKSPLSGTRLGACLCFR